MIEVSDSFTSLDLAEASIVWNFLTLSDSRSSTFFGIGVINNCLGRTVYAVNYFIMQALFPPSPHYNRADPHPNLLFALTRFKISSQCNEVEIQVSPRNSECVAGGGVSCGAIPGTGGP
jgi:hypothetical protein